MKLKIEVDVEELVQELFDDCDPEEGIEVDIRKDIKLDIIHKTKVQVIKKLHSNDMLKDGVFETLMKHK